MKKPPGGGRHGTVGWRARECGDTDRTIEKSLRFASPNVNGIIYNECNYFDFSAVREPHTDGWAARTSLRSQNAMQNAPVRMTSATTAASRLPNSASSE